MKLKELEKRLKSEPDNLGLRVQVAGLMREAGRSIEAVELYRSVALAYRDQGRTQQAIAVCRSILEIAPEDAACQGLITMLQGRGTPSRPPPAALEQPHVGPAVRAATAGTAPGTQQPQQRPASAVTPVHITEPVQVPSMPHLRQPDSVDSSSNKPADPARRSSLDETPLPRPIPYHVSDPTSQPHKISARELEEKSSAPNVTSRTGGLAEAARRISGLISSNKDSVVTGIPGIPNKEMDLAAELDTRQRPKIKSEELKKLSHPLPDPDETSPRAMEARRIANPIHDIDTRDPLLDDLATEPIEPLTPPPRGSSDDSGMFTPTPPRDYTPKPGDDFYTPPPRGSDDAITPPPLLGVVPPDVIEPPRSTALPSRPPKKVSIPPAGAGKTKSAPPLGTEPPIRRAPVLPSQQKPAAVGRPPLSRVPKSRDSDDELTKPRDRLSDDSDDD
ncbi:MAG TPA: hypothetical protein VL326_21505 [Kofleriaceae bacterium]|nr:hypothetical protein [Kofleriaceae bacterium]